MIAAKPKPVRMKTYLAWQVVNRNGTAVWHETDSSEEKALDHCRTDWGERIARVEVREVERKGRKVKR